MSNNEWIVVVALVVFVGLVFFGKRARNVVVTPPISGGSAAPPTDSGTPQKRPS